MQMNGIVFRLVEGFYFKLSALNFRTSYLGLGK